MVRVLFPQVLERHVPCPPVTVAATTVRAALEAAFREQPQVRDYLLDERGRLRQHIAVFVDGAPLRDREGMSDPVHDAAEIHVLQALSGG